MIEKELWAQAVPRNLKKKKVLLCQPYHTLGPNRGDSSCLGIQQESLGDDGETSFNPTHLRCITLDEVTPPANERPYLRWRWTTNRWRLTADLFFFFFPATLGKAAVLAIIAVSSVEISQTCLVWSQYNHLRGENQWLTFSLKCVLSFSGGIFLIRSHTA